MLKILVDSSGPSEDKEARSKHTGKERIVCSVLDTCTEISYLASIKIHVPLLSISASLSPFLGARRQGGTLLGVLEEARPYRRFDVRVLASRIGSESMSVVLIHPVCGDLLGQPSDTAAHSIGFTRGFRGFTPESSKRHHERKEKKA